MKMIRAIALAALAAVSGLPPAVARNPAEGERLSRCLVDNTTVNERNHFARRVFIPMAAHPEIRPLAAVTPADVDDAVKSWLGAFERFLDRDKLATLDD